MAIERSATGGAVCCAVARDPVLPAARFDLASFGELVSDPSRVAMLLALMDGAARPASELARLAGIAPSTASFHLQRLVGGGLVRVEAVGRHRYARLASTRVADALEAVALVRTPDTRRALTAEQRRLAGARTCYRHLAGGVGVAWLIGLENARLLRARGGALTLTRRGQDWCRDHGLDAARWPGGKHCLDWTERRHHLGGPLGALLTAHLFTLRWLARRAGEPGRAVRVTTTGRRELTRLAIPAAILDAAR
jgi:DNA-binding transcriptional ArsR family regulator